MYDILGPFLLRPPNLEFLNSVCADRLYIVSARSLVVSAQLFLEIS